MDVVFLTFRVVLLGFRRAFDSRTGFDESAFEPLGELMSSELRFLDSDEGIPQSFDLKLVLETWT